MKNGSTSLARTYEFDLRGVLATRFIFLFLFFSLSGVSFITISLQEERSQSLVRVEWRACVAQRMKALRTLSLFFSAGCIAAALAPKNGQGVVIRWGRPA